MKKALFVLVFLALGWQLKAECPPEVEDFTFTDCNGLTYNLFELLDGGQYVLVHFQNDFSGYGQTLTMNNLYHQYGCNGRDVFFMDLLTHADDAQCQSWAEEHHIEFPVIGMDGGSSSFYALYPDCIYDYGNNQFLLFLPDHQIFQEPIVYHFEEVFSDLGIVPSDCNLGQCEAPNNLTAHLSASQLDLEWEGVEGAQYYHVFSRNYAEEDFHFEANTVEPNIENVTYYPTEENCYYVTSRCEDGSENNSDTICVGPEALDFELVDCHGNEIHLFDILDRGQFVFVDFFGFTCISCREAMPYIVESYYRYGCNNEDIFYMEVTDDPEHLCFRWCEEFGVEYPTVGMEGGAQTFADLYHLTASPHYFLIAPNREIVLDGGHSGFYIYDLQTIIDAFEPLGIEVHQCYSDVFDNQQEGCVIYPNPADGVVNIEAQGLIQVYNSLGQLKDAIVSDSQQVRLQTGRYMEGLYLVKVNGKGLGKFVVKH